jgi:hypothetical protein
MYLVVQLVGDFCVSLWSWLLGLLGPLGLSLYAASSPGRVTRRLRHLRTARKTLRIKAKQTDSGWMWIAGGR